MLKILQLTVRKSCWS